MKNLKEFRPLIKLLGDDKKRLIIASILIFVASISEIFTGYLNGAAVEAITNIEIRKSLLYLGIYFTIEVLLKGGLSHIANSMLYKIESALTRKLGYFTYKK